VISILGVSVLVASFMVRPVSDSPFPHGGVSQWLGGWTAQATSTAVATHATKGVVKSIDSNSLVITRSTRRMKEQTFAIDGSTRQVGKLTVGATVEIRYRTQDGHRVATVVSVQEASAQR
jgi:hypothetical protein